MQENENINFSLTELDSKYKSKVPNTSDFKKKVNLAKSYNSKKIEIDEPKNNNTTNKKEKKVKINSKKK